MKRGVEAPERAGVNANDFRYFPGLGGWEACFEPDFGVFVFRLL